MVAVAVALALIVAIVVDRLAVATAAAMTDLANALRHCERSRGTALEQNALA